MNDNEFIAKVLTDSRPAVPAAAKHQTVLWCAFGAWLMAVVVVCAVTFSNRGPAYPPIREAPAPTPRPTPTPIVLSPRAKPAPATTPVVNPPFVPQPAPTRDPFFAGGQPASGELRTFAQCNRIASMTVKTSAGQDYLVRLYEGGRQILSVYIRGGRTETFKVPLGAFEVKFATGTDWQDYWNLFGPSTTYAKADDTFTFDRSPDGRFINTWTVTLYTVPNGNLAMSPIPPVNSNFTRLAYLGCWALLFVGGFMIGLSDPYHYQESPAVALLLFSSIPLMIMATALRLRNIGQSGWLAALLFVPLLCVLLILYCFIAPSGYHTHRQMDWIGGTAIAAIAALVTTVIALAIFG